MTPRTPMIATYRLPEPFERAVKLLREALARDELRTPMELDVSGRISRELGIGLAPCRLLGVDCPLILLEAITLDGAAAVLLPMHILVYGRGTQTIVHVFRPASPAGPDIPVETAIPVIKLQTRIARVMEKIAMREELCGAIP
jgi:uncharacterized protein (DUF302 family)